MQQELTPKQQTSEAIRQAETILVMTGQNPTVDQIAAVLSMAAILRKFGKKVSAIVSDPMPTGTSFMDSSLVDKTLNGLRDFIVRVDLKRAEVDKLRYEVQDGKLNVHITPFAGSFSKDDVTFDYGEYHFDLAIVLGVGNRSRIDRVYGDNAHLFSNVPVLNVDFRRSNEGYGAVNLIEPNAASLCEILVATSESLQTGLIDADIATTMLAGLMSSTDRFTAAHTTSKSMTVAAQLMAAGARQQQVVTGLFGGGTRDTRGGRSEAAGRDARPAREERSDRKPDRDTKSGERDGRSLERNDRDKPSDRGDKPERSDRAERGERSDRPDRGERPARDDRPARDGERKDRPAPADRNDVTEPASREERGRDASAERPVVEPEPRERVRPFEPQPDATGNDRDAALEALSAALDAPLPGGEPEPRERPTQALDAQEGTAMPSVMTGTTGTPESDRSEPLIDPGHIQLTPVDDGPAPVSEQMAVDVPAMADFSAVQRSQEDEAVRDADRPAVEDAPSPDQDDTSKASRRER